MEESSQRRSFIESEPLNPATIYKKEANRVSDQTRQLSSSSLANPQDLQKLSSSIFGKARNTSQSIAYTPDGFNNSHRDSAKPADAIPISMSGYPQPNTPSQSGSSYAGEDKFGCSLSLVRSLQPGDGFRSELLEKTLHPKVSQSPTPHLHPPGYSGAATRPLERPTNPGGEAATMPAYSMPLTAANDIKQPIHPGGSILSSPGSQASGRANPLTNPSDARAGSLISGLTNPEGVLEGSKDDLTHAQRLNRRSFLNRTEGGRDRISPLTRRLSTESEATFSGAEPKWWNASKHKHLTEQLFDGTLDRGGSGGGVNSSADASYSTPPPYYTAEKRSKNPLLNTPQYMVGSMAAENRTRYHPPNTQRGSMMNDNYVNPVSSLATPHPPGATESSLPSLRANDYYQSPRGRTTSNLLNPVYIPSEPRKHSIKLEEDHRTSSANQPLSSLPNTQGISDSLTRGNTDYMRNSSSSILKNHPYYTPSRPRPNGLLGGSVLSHQHPEGSDERDYEEASGKAEEEVAQRRLRNIVSSIPINPSSDDERLGNKPFDEEKKKYLYINDFSQEKGFGGGLGGASASSPYNEGVAEAKKMSFPGNTELSRAFESRRSRSGFASGDISRYGGVDADFPGGGGGKESLGGRGGDYFENGEMANDTHLARRFRDSIRVPHGLSERNHHIHTHTRVDKQEAQESNEASGLDSGEDLRSSRGKHQEEGGGRQEVGDRLELGDEEEAYLIDGRVLDKRPMPSSWRYQRRCNNDDYVASIRGFRDYAHYKQKEEAAYSRNNEWSIFAMHNQLLRPLKDFEWYAGENCRMRTKFLSTPIGSVKYYLSPNALPASAVEPYIFPNPPRDFYGGVEDLKMMREIPNVIRASSRRERGGFDEFSDFFEQKRVRSCEEREILDDLERLLWYDPEPRMERPYRLYAESKLCNKGFRLNNIRDCLRMGW